MKKCLSLLLAMLLIFSVFSLISVSAENEAEEIKTNRYYFYMPTEWENKYSTTAGIYWWEGTDACSDWPGYEANKTEIEGLFYYDVPKDVTAIIWNNFIDGGTDYNSEVYELAKQSGNIGCEYYDKQENELYPDGLESFDGMIYVIDYDKIDHNSWDYSLRGEWYYYYGNGEYGTTPEKGEEYNTERHFGTPPSEVEPPTKPEIPTMTLYFINSINWEQVYIHYYTNSTKYPNGGSNSVPGDLMELVATDENGNDVYSYNVPVDATGVIFSDGNEKSHDAVMNLTDGTAFELTEILDGKYLYKTYDFTDKVTLLGDVNLDGKLNIKDATAIQKHLANIEMIEGLGKPAADFNQDGKITIKDATAIQKKIANIA